MSRSLLFVPGDAERKMHKAAATNADALILDLEDSVAASARPAARALTASFIEGRDDAWVRINPIDTADAVADLEAVLPAAPRGIMLPKPRSAADVIDLATRLDALEAAHELRPGSTKIIALCTERPEALFTLHGYIGATPRLEALSWGAEDLAAAVGASANRNEKGAWLPQFEMARSLCLFAAAAAEVMAIDTVFTDFKDASGLAAYAAAARRDGFAGMLAIHPDQVDIINAAFTPTEEEIRHAQRIVEAFDASPGAGTVGLDGRMIDRPHLVQARRLLDRARED